MHVAVRMLWCITACMFSLKLQEKEKNKIKLSSIIPATSHSPTRFPFPQMVPALSASRSFLGALSRRLQAERSHMGQKHPSGPLRGHGQTCRASLAVQASRCRSGSYLSLAKAGPQGRGPIQALGGARSTSRGLTPRKST